MNEKKNRFRTQYDRERIYSRVGDPVHILYEAKFDSSGHYDLVESGRENTYDFIQSHKDSVDIHLILKRFANGDTAALSRKQGMYGDFTQMPTSFADMLNKVNAAESYFNSLDAETRSKFDDSFGIFMASIGSDDFMDKLGLVKADPVPVPDPVPGGDPVE